MILAASLLAIGIGLAIAHNGPGSVFFIPSLISFAIVIWFFCRQQPRAAVACAAATIFIIGYGLGTHALMPHVTPAHLTSWLPPKGATVLCEGILAARPTVGIERAQLLVDLTHCRDQETPDLMRPVMGRVLLSLPQIAVSLVSGDRIRFLGGLHLIRPYRNPGGDRRFWRRMAYGIVATGWIEDPAFVTQIGTDGSWRIRRWLDRWANQVEERLATITSGADADDLLGVLTAAITGNGAALSPAAWERFRHVGVLHLLVISGFQVGCVGLLLWALSSWIARRSAWMVHHLPTWKLVSAVSVAGVWIYAGFVGADPPVVRAAWMVSAIMLAWMVDRRPDPASAVALAVCCLLAWSPLVLVVPSFQLTFAAVIGIICWWPWCRRKYLPADRREKPWPARAAWTMADSAVVGVAATIGLMPLLAYHFHTTSQMGLLMTMLLGPIVGFLLTPLGLLFALVAPWSAAAATIVGWPLRWLGEGILAMVDWADRGSATWQIGFTPFWWEIVAWYAAWTVPLLWQRRRWRHSLVTVVATCCCLSGWARIGPMIREQPLTITFLDVGQGSAAVIRFPNRAAMMVDGGGVARSPFDIGRWVVAPALHHLQIGRLNSLVLTHPHPDHYGGIPYLAETFAPEVIFTNGAIADADDPLWPGVVARIAAAGVPIRTLTSAAESIVEGEVTIRTLHPGPEGPQIVYGQNNNSLVYLLEYRDIRILLTGDIEREGEEQLLGRGGLPQIDLLQAPHHGSDTSSTAQLLAALRPRIAVISCGRDNRYGFPSPAVLKRLEGVGAQVYRTDLHGAVTVRTDGKHLDVKTYD